MRPEEKFCPLTKMTCKGNECAWWRHPGCCAISTIASSIHGVDNELYMIRQDIGELERRL